jgi:hypothetical protein
LCRTASTWHRVIPDHVEAERTLKGCMVGYLAEAEPVCAEG